MKNKKIIRLTENDIQRLVKKIIAEGSFKEDTLIEKTYDLLELLGYNYVEDFYIQSLEEAAEILEAETYQHGSILDGEIQNLLTEIYSIIGFPGEDEDDYMDDDEESPYGDGEDPHRQGEESPYGDKEDPHFRKGEESPYGEDDEY